jgi:hypothetical protein
MRRAILWPALFLFTSAALAQQRPIFDPDDEFDPRDHAENVFISRMIAGVVLDDVDDYRPLGQDAGFVELANTLYAGSWQIGFKRSVTAGEHGAPRLFRCGCTPPVIFPTAPPANATPAAPPPGSRDTLQFGWYRAQGGAFGTPPIMLRTQLTVTRRDIDTTIRSASSEEVIDRHMGHEQSIGLDTDTHFIVRGHDMWGSLSWARTRRYGTEDEDDRTQQEFAYTARPPGWEVGRVLMRTTFTVGGVTNRGGTALNVVHPALEAFVHSYITGVNVHAAWSPLAMRDGLHRWRTRNQVALFIDRALWVHPLR